MSASKSSMKGWFSFSKSKEKKEKVKTPKDKKEGEQKEKKESLYDRFLKDKIDKKPSAHNEYDASKSQKHGEDNSKSKNNKKPKLKNSDQQKKTIEQMIQEDLDPKEFAEIIKNIKKIFPDSNTSWLFEASFYFNNKVPSKVADVLNVFNNALDYPLSIMKDEFKNELHELFKLFTNQELYQIQLTIIETIIPNIYSAGTVTGPVGYLLFLQSLSNYLGQNSTENIERLESPTIRNKHKEKPNVYLTQIWCVQSTGHSSLVEGLTIWKRLFSPVIDHKYYYQFSLKYLQQVLSYNSNYKDAQGIIDVKDLIRILRLKTAAEHKDILDKILPKLKLLILSHQTDNEIVASFKELISSLSLFKNESQIEEFIINCLVYCLDRNKSCFDVWLEHHKNSDNKDVLLEHLLANSNSIQNQKKALRSTIQSIAKFNDKSGHQNYQSKDILKTMSNHKSRRLSYLVIILVALIVYVAYDFRLNGSFERSNTARYLKRWRMYNYVQPVAINIERNIISLKRQYDVKYGPTVNLYVDQIVKKYDANIRPTVDPYLSQASNVLSPYVNSARDSSVQLYRAAWKHYTVYSNQMVNYLQKNVFTGALSFDNIQVVLSDSFEKFTNAYADLYYWANNKISALIK